MQKSIGDNQKLDLKIFNSNNPQLDILDIWRVESSQDNLLKEYFLQTSAFLELSTTKKFLVAGRKGTGKSALKSQFEEQYKNKANTFVLNLNFDDIFTSTFFDNITYEDNKTYRDLIKFLMLIRLLMIIADEDLVSQNDRNVIIEFLQYNGFRLESFSQLYGKLQNDDEILVDKIGINLFGVVSGEKSFKNEKDSFNKINYSQLLPDLELYIFNTLEKIGKDYYILIDKLDEFWSSYGDVYNRIIVSFLTVIKDLNYKFRNSKKSSKSKIIIFIRSDMVEIIRGLDGNLNKIWQDEMIKIDWQSDLQLGILSNLCKMIEKRIEYGLKFRNGNHYYKSPYIKNALEYTYILKDDPYLGLKHIDNLEIKKGLFNRTFLRPRDFVKFFHFLSISNSWENFMKSYSDYLLGEIQDELTPILMKIGKIDIAIKALSKTVSNNRAIFSANEYIENYKKIYLLENFNEDEKKIENNARKTLNKLYDYSVFGNIDKNMDFYRFNYRENNIISFDETQQCILHSGLYKALGVI
ncbi:MAG: hypothetical protein PHG82_04515 [Candidatus Gracilibacteria bacterium]|nr:hypothetical protein [Candidatus Gracilibacteria bacterium]